VHQNDGGKDSKCHGRDDGHREEGTIDRPRPRRKKPGQNGLPGFARGRGRGVGRLQ
jgi:hypothetical protein